MPRTLRSATRKTAAPKPNPQQQSALTTPLPGLTATETRLLRKKQLRLRLTSPDLLRTAASHGDHITTALKATLIFAQHEAGTAVCIQSRGYILTCAHCFGESEEEWQAERIKYLLTYDGIPVRVECVVWDVTRDLALARVLAVEDGATFRFTPIPLADSTILTSQKTYIRTPILCIGQPGADDLESATPQETGYDLLNVSEGKLRGLVPGADPHDNSEIGSLKHDAWTYWGHSGAPLVYSGG
ncbi:hypothetical protein BJY04DRAFT_219000 [Aspergillus karnatakaensis]|uniref:S1 family peptidase n=1 Tax=Aspergillus karnatakaensis TaxID=1810916 RepID=UPI003CCDF017